MLSLSENGVINVDNGRKCVHIQDCTVICGCIRICWDWDLLMAINRIFTLWHQLFAVVLRYGRVRCISPLMYAMLNCFTVAVLQSQAPKPRPPPS